MSAAWWSVGLVGVTGAGAGAGAATVVARELTAHHAVDRVLLIAGTALGWALATVYLGVSWSLPAVLYLVALAGALTVTDLRVHRLPNRLVLVSYPVVAVLLVLAVADHDHRTSLLCAVAGALGLFAVFLVAAVAGPLGGGDVKLAAVVGAYLGWAGGAGAVVGGVAVTVVAAAVVAGVGMGPHRMRRDTALAYGPFMLLGCLVGVAVHLP